jgi:cephalosporin hydroxylase
MIPPPVRSGLSDPLREHWLRRIRQLSSEVYVGVPLRKLAEDLRVYEHLLWRSRANVVIELGTKMGGSALWFRDRLATIAAYGRIERPLVITIDVATALARRNFAAVDPSWRDSITLVKGDVRDATLADEVRKLVPRGARCLVSEDSAHTYETTLAALRGFSAFVPAGGFFVVEDGSVDIEEMRPQEQWPRGVLRAIDDWLATEEGSRFRARRDLELYGISTNPGGYLERVAA